MVWRHPDAVLNDPEPSESELNDAFLTAIRGCPSRVRPFPEHLLVLLGVSNIWGKADRDPVLVRNGVGMHFFPYAFSYFTLLMPYFLLFCFYQLCLLWTSSRVTIRPTLCLRMPRLFRVRMLWLGLSSKGFRARAMLVLPMSRVFLSPTLLSLQPADLLVVC